jgi:FkbM family methyltransferase
MAIKAWKQFEQSPGYQRLKVKAKRLVGKELRLKPDLEVDCVSDGGWNYDSSLLDPFSIVYSLGVGDLIDFDLGVIKRCQSSVYAFDPTPSSRTYVESDERPRQFHFHPWAAAGEDGTLVLYPRVKHDGSLSDDMFTLQPEDASTEAGISVPAYSVETLTQKLGHSRIDLLKMDIEGAEYDVLEGMLATDIRPKQLLVEFHHRYIDNGLKRTADIIARLRESGYQIISVAEDTGREVAFRYMP